jgi:hypothetical protein
VFLTLRLMMFEKVLGVGAERRWLYLAAKPPHMGSMQTAYPSPYTVLAPAVDKGT